MTRLYDWTPKGERAVDAAPVNYGDNVTILRCPLVPGLDAVMTVDGATDTAVFRTFVNRVLVPVLKPGDVVVMDNLGAHRVAGIREAIEGAGAGLVHLPLYSPDFSPIEKCWSKFKGLLRAARARQREALDEAVTEAIQWTGDSDAAGWFASCGYALH